MKKVENDKSKDSVNGSFDVGTCPETIRNRF